jgi:hypothetical protein
MKSSVVSLCFAIAVIASSSSAVRAQDDALQSARAAARRALEAANLELRLYLQVDHPRELRHLDAQIKLVEAEIAAYEERFREYRPFNKFSTGRPLLLPMQDLRLSLLAAELSRDDLRAERNALIRFHSDRWRLLELRAYEARARLAELEKAGQNVGPAAVARN